MKLKRATIVLLSTMVLMGSCRTQKPSTSNTLPKYKRQAFEKAYFEASKHKILNNKDKAISKFEESLAVNPNSHEAMYQLANIYFQKGNLSKALSWSEKSVKTNPNYNHWYTGQLAQLYNKLGMYQRSAETFKTMISNEPKVTDGYIEASNQYLNLSQPNEAIEILLSMQEKFGIREKSAKRLSFIYSKLGDKEKAEEQLKLLSESQPANPGFHQNLAEFYMKEGNTSAAISSLNDIITLQDSSSGYVYFMLYEVYKLDNQDKKAFEYLQLAFGSSDVSLESKLQALSSYFIKKEISESKLSELDVLGDILINTHGTAAEPLVVKSDIALQRDNPVAARSYILKALEKDQSDFQVWRKLLFVDVLLENVQYQIEDSEKALELYPNVVFLYITNAYAYFDASQYEKAIDAANGGLEIAIEKPEKIELLSCKASALSKMGKSKSADYQFNKALSLNPYNPDMLNNYAYSLADRGERLSFADSLISKALSSNPSQPGYLDTKAWVLYKMGTYKEAASFAERAVSLDPASKGFLEHLLAIYDKQGRTEDVAKIRLKLEAIEK